MAGTYLRTPSVVNDQSAMDNYSSSTKILRRDTAIRNSAITSKISSIVKKLTNVFKVTK